MTDNIGFGRSAMTTPFMPQATFPEQTKSLVPTTQKRVGRSLRKPPGPSVDDGPGEGEISTEEVAEDLSAAPIEAVQHEVAIAGRSAWGQASAEDPQEGQAQQVNPSEAQDMRHKPRKLLPDTLP